MRLGKAALKYVIVGAAAAGFYFLLYVSLAEWLSLAPSLALLSAYAVTLVLAYVGSARWTFGHVTARRGAFKRYLVVSLMGFVLNEAALRIFVDGFGMWHVGVQAAITILLPLFSFVMQHFWVFQGEPEFVTQPMEQDK